MNLDFDEIQLMLRTQARDFISEQSPPTSIKEVVQTSEGYSRDIWKGMADLGWMGIPFPEQYGGVDMSFFELLLILLEMGRGALPGPLLSTMLCGLAISEFGGEAQKEELLPKIATGELIFALAWTEPSASWEPSGVALQAIKGGTDYKLNGTKLFCPDAHIADKLLVVTRTAEATKDDPAYGITLFITPAKDSAVACYPQDSIGFDNQSQIDFKDLVVDQKDMLGELNKGWPIVEKLLGWGALGKCAEMIGATERALEMSVDYANERVQYGKHIGAYQKQQHRLADMWIALESSRNYFYEAGWLLSSGNEDPMNVSIAKAMISEAAEELLDQAVLLHGAIGLTWDYDLGLHFRRVRAATIQFGDARYHRNKIARLMEKRMVEAGNL
jgi:alkylation response protein AidB-like acyl-CoA dehydrogenase